MIELDIVTPTRRLVVGARTKSLKLPGAVGQLEILPGHTELLTLLSNGVLSFEASGRERRFAVSYGFAEVRNDRVVILAETAEESTEIDLDRAKRAERQAEQSLAASLTEDQFRKYRLKLERSLVRQQAARTE